MAPAMWKRVIAISVDYVDVSNAAVNKGWVFFQS
jgi:hypothetical protein